MADLKGFKQVSLSTYLATSEENRKDYLWFVREFSGETVVSSAIYFGNRKYADLTGEIEADAKVANVIASLGDFVDENGEWVGFLPVEAHDLLGNSGVTSVSDALSVLEAAILENIDAISGKVSKEEYDEKITELENAISGASGSIGEIVSEISGLSANLESLSEKVENVEEELSEKADASDLNALSGSVESVKSDVQKISEKTEDLDDSLSALTAVVETKANASDVYTKNEVYTKEETDAKVVGTFKFKGNAEAISADETTLTVNGEPVVASSANTGYVYQIDDAEYASNGEKWVKLGFNIDLTNYATKDFVNSGIAEEAAARELLAGEVELVQSALTAEITEREALSEEVEEIAEKVEDLEERSTITALTYTEASELPNLRLGKIVYVTTEETVSGITYGSGAYINTQGGLKKLDATTPSTSTTLEERVETLENKVGNIEEEIGDTEYAGDSISSAIAALQAKFEVTGDDVEE